MVVDPQSRRRPALVVRPPSDGNYDQKRAKVSPITPLALEIHMNRTRTLTLGATIAATLVTPMAVGSAQASGGAAVTRHGTCAGGATYTLKAKHDDGLVEVEWEVDSNRAGRSWTVRLRDNGSLFFSGSRTTQAPSGSFTVRRTTPNRTGGDVIRARSVHGNDVCAAHLTV
jgi:hypothetical protein